jgi:hypothetical protein
LVAAWALLKLAHAAEPRLSWFGLALTALGPLSFLTRQYLAGSNRKQPHHLGYTTVAGLGLGICMALSWRFGTAAGSVHIWAGVSLLAWVAYLRFIQRPPASPGD